MNSIGSENMMAKSFEGGVAQTPSSFERHSAAAAESGATTAAAAAAVGESSFKPRPPRITVDEERPAVGRHPSSKSGLCLWDAAFLDPPTTSVVLPERRRHSYQMPVSTTDNQDEEGAEEEEDSRGPQYPSSSSSFVSCSRRRKSRTEEPYVFALSQAAGRTPLDRRRGSAPASPETKKSEFQKQGTRSPPSSSSSSSFPEKQQQQQQSTGKPVKHRAARSSDPVEPSAEGYATAIVVEDMSPTSGRATATHSRWSTRALSLPASEYLVLLPVGLFPGDGAAREAGEKTGSRRQTPPPPSSSSSSLLVFPPEEAPYRRRSVSHLEAISEETSGGGCGQKTAAVRRYSIPSRPPNDP